MISFAIFAILLCAADAKYPRLRSGTERIFENEINVTINDLAEALSKKDPLSIPEFNLDISNSFLNLSLHAQDIVLIDFSKFVATKIKVKPFSLSMELNIRFSKPHFVITLYDIDLTAIFVPFYGVGSLNFLPKNIDVGISGSITIGSNGIQIKKAIPTFTLTDSFLDVSGLLNNQQFSDIVSSSTTECFPEFINNYEKRLGELVSPALTDLLNQLLGDLSYKNRILPKRGSIKKYDLDVEDFKGSLRIRY